MWCLLLFVVVLLSICCRSNQTSFPKIWPKHPKETLSLAVRQNQLQVTFSKWTFPLKGYHWVFSNRRIFDLFWTHGLKTRTVLHLFSGATWHSLAPALLEESRPSYHRNQSALICCKCQQSSNLRRIPDLKAWKDEVISLGYILI